MASSRGLLHCSLPGKIRHPLPYVAFILIRICFSVALAFSSSYLGEVADVEQRALAGRRDVDSTPTSADVSMVTLRLSLLIYKMGMLSLAKQLNQSLTGLYEGQMG